MDNNTALQEALQLLDTHKAYCADPRNGETEKAYFDGLFDMLSFLISNGYRDNRGIAYNAFLGAHEIISGEDPGNGDR